MQKIAKLTYSQLKIKILGAKDKSPTLKCNFSEDTRIIDLVKKQSAVQKREFRNVPETF